MLVIGLLPLILEAEPPNGHSQPETRNETKLTSMGIPCPYGCNSHKREAATLPFGNGKVKCVYLACARPCKVETIS